MECHRHPTVDQSPQEDCLLACLTLVWAAVEEWLGSGKAVHSMRDHPAHFIPMLGAGWGARLDTEAGTERKI